MKKATLAAVAPYAVWMALLFALPATATSYALRTTFALIALTHAFRVLEPALKPWIHTSLPRTLVWGLLVGALVCFLWIFPERFPLYRDTTLSSLVASVLRTDTPPLPTAHCPLPTAN